MARYIYQQNNWTHFTWDDKSISPLLGEVRNLQGRLIGKMSAFGFSLQKEAVLNTLTVEALKTSEIEGEKLNLAQVRSSIARRLGIEISDWVYSDRNVEGVVEMMIDATQNYTHPLSEERLFAWHSALFPTGFSGMHKIAVGQYRTGEMQIVSGAIGKDKVHYQAPAPQTLKEEMDKFIAWFNSALKIDPVIKAAIAHLWFVTIHPFDDGNGRITRALSDMLLARGDDTSMRFYSMSSQILKERKKYYTALEKSQHGESDITHWINWFLACLRLRLIWVSHSFPGTEPGKLVVYPAETEVFLL